MFIVCCTALPSGVPKHSAAKANGPCLDFTIIPFWLLPRLHLPARDPPVTHSVCGKPDHLRRSHVAA